jgi:molybdenum cofactor cytidylyltransferase
MASQSEIAGIVLAAGTSSRMGQNKMLLAFAGETLLRGAARRALAGGLSPLIVVLGAEADRAAAELEGLPCDIVRNRQFQSGMTSSMHAGLAALPTEMEAAIILLADMPLVTADMIREMTHRYHDTGAPLVISRYEGVIAPPTLFDRRLFEELLANSTEGAGKQVVERHRADAEVLDWPAATLSDLDTPEDYARVTAR